MQIAEVEFIGFVVIPEQQARHVMVFSSVKRSAAEDAILLFCVIEFGHFIASKPDLLFQLLV